MEKINKSCGYGNCCSSCSNKWKSNGERCKKACDNYCENCSCKREKVGYYHDGGWYND